LSVGHSHLTRDIIAVDVIIFIIIQLHRNRVRTEF